MNQKQAATVYYHLEVILKQPWYENVETCSLAGCRRIRWGIKFPARLPSLACVYLGTSMTAPSHAVTFQAAKHRVGQKRPGDRTVERQTPKRHTARTAGIRTNADFASTGAPCTRCALARLVVSHSFICLYHSFILFCCLFDFNLVFNSTPPLGVCFVFCLRTWFETTL